MSRKKGNDIKMAAHLIFLAFILESAGFLISYSFALLADALFVFTDFLFFALLSYALKRGRKSRSLVSLSLVLMLAVFGLGLLVMYSSVYRFVFGGYVRGPEMLTFAFAGLGINMYVTRRAGKRFRLGLRDSFLYISRKTLPSSFVIGAGIWIAFTGEIFVDCLFGVIISVMVMLESVILFRDSAFLLLGVPRTRTCLFRNIT